jgi:DNA polymerase elongation subunit (family B)
MLIEIEKLEDSVNLSYLDTTGKINMYNLPVSNHKWVLTDKQTKSTQLNWQNKHIKKIKSQKLSKWSILEAFWSMPREDHDKIFNYVEPNISIVDIETDWNGGKDSNYENEITTIAIVQKQLAVVIGTKELTQEEISDIEKSINGDVKNLNTHYTFKYIRVKDEYNLLVTFWQMLSKKLGLITGWNVVNFDMTYLIKRAKYHGIDISSASLSNKVDKVGRPLHQPWIDYAAIFDKWDKSIEAKENNTLDYVSNAVLGIKKVNYDGSLYNLYRTDFKKYVYYNIIDAVLVNEIDKKKKLINLLAKISSLCKVELEQGSSPVSCGESLLSYEYYLQNRYIDEIPTKSTGEKYKGAFVKDPVPGLYNGIVCFDYSSLYPSTMRALNISPETYLGQFSGLELEKYLNNAEYIVSSENTVFSSSEGALKRILTKYYAMRKASQKKYKEWDKILSKLNELI